MLTKLNQHRDRENGFTLVELLIVVLIIGILAAIAIPVYLGLQNQAKNSATKQDTNSTVHAIQVALTEGQTLGDALNANTDSANRGDGTQVVSMAALDGSRNYTVTGTQKDTGFTYTYDSATGKFTEGSGNIALGGGSGSSNVAPTITSAKPTATGSTGISYSYTVTATGTPTPTFTATGLPTGLGISLTSGIISGTPTTAGTYNYTITASNGTSPDATQTGSIVITTPVTLASWDFEDGSTTGWGADNTGTSLNNLVGLAGHTKSLQLRGNTTYTNASISANSITTVVGKSYTYSADIYVLDAPTDFQIYLYTGQVNSPTISTRGSWQTITHTFTATRTTLYPYVWLYSNSSTSGFSVNYAVDNIKIVKNN